MMSSVAPGLDRLVVLIRAAGQVVSARRGSGACLIDKLFSEYSADDKIRSLERGALADPGLCTFIDSYANCQADGIADLLASGDCVDEAEVAAFEALDELYDQTLSVSKERSTVPEANQTLALAA